MRDAPTLPFRPPRDLSTEARLAVEASRLRSRRKLAPADKTLYMRTTRTTCGVPAPASSSASLLWAGVIAALLTWIAALALCLLA